LPKKIYVSLTDLKSINNLVSNHVGRAISSCAPVAAAGAEGVGKGIPPPKVRKGDTLTRIARKTGVSAGELKRLNSLGKKKVKAGQVLVLKDADKEVDPGRACEESPTPLQRPFNEKDYEQALRILPTPIPTSQ
jgi:LysM repeat protein